MPQVQHGSRYCSIIKLYLYDSEIVNTVPRFTYLVGKTGRVVLSDPIEKVGT